MEFHWTHEYLFETGPENYDRDCDIVLEDSDGTTHDDRFRITRIEDFQSIVIAYGGSDFGGAMAHDIYQLDNDEFLFHGKGLIWRITIDWPNVTSKLATIDPVRSMVFDGDRNVLAVAGWTEIALLGRDGAEWVSKRVSIDGIENLKINPDCVIADVFVGNGDEQVRLEVADWEGLTDIVQIGGLDYPLQGFST